MGAKACGQPAVAPPGARGGHWACGGPKLLPKSRSAVHWWGFVCPCNAVCWWGPGCRCSAVHWCRCVGLGASGWRCQRVVWPSTIGARGQKLGHLGQQLPNVAPGHQPRLGGTGPAVRTPLQLGVQLCGGVRWGPWLPTPRQYLTPYKCVFKGVVRTITNTVARRVIEIPWGARV